MTCKICNITFFLGLYFFGLGPKRNTLCTNKIQNLRSIISLEGRKCLGFVIYRITFEFT